MFTRTPFIFPLLYPTLVWRLPGKTPTLYLTFDDGPVPGPTEFVLDVLHTHGIKATFFCIGDNIRKHPDVFQRVLNAGHGVGNHTFNHLNGWKTSASAYVANTKKFSEQVALINVGLNINLFRPPYGRLTHRQIRLLRDYRIIMWDVLTHDYNRGLTPERCLKNSLQAIRNGSIVVFHDSLKAERNLTYVLPRFIEACLERGYTFKLIL
ncbi:MAG: polysaccharide deacetylase family protein [Cyclobacteriaceae bacterium]|nr:polysaccharide deacetylase family protein [Cyclobacteriaceae bacterium]